MRKERLLAACYRHLHRRNTRRPEIGMDASLNLLTSVRDREWKWKKRRRFCLIWRSNPIRSAVRVTRIFASILIRRIPTSLTIASQGLFAKVNVFALPPLRIWSLFALSLLDKLFICIIFSRRYVAECKCH